MSEKLVIGVDFGGQSARIGYIDSEGNIVGNRTYPNYPEDMWTEETKQRYWNDELTEREERELYETCIRNLIENIESYSNDYSSVTGIGIGSPGPLDPEEGIIINPPNLPGWRNIDLKKIIEEKTDLPVEVNNDANTAALGEYMFGAGKNSPAFLLNTLGTGMGWGAVLNGELYEGPSGLGFELWKTPFALRGDEKEENYDFYGCADGPLRIFLRRLELTHGKTEAEKGINFWFGDIPNVKDIAQAASEERKGEKHKRCREAFEEYGQVLGRMILPVVNALEIHTYAYSGTGARDDVLFGNALKETVERGMTRDGPISIQRAQLGKIGEDAGLVGAACLVRAPQEPYPL